MTMWDDERGALMWILHFHIEVEMWGHGCAGVTHGLKKAPVFFLPNKSLFRDYHQDFGMVFKVFSH